MLALEVALELGEAEVAGPPLGRASVPLPAWLESLGGLLLFHLFLDRLLGRGVLSHLGSHPEDLGGLRMEKEGLLAIFELALQRRAVTSGRTGKQGVARLFFHNLGAEEDPLVVGDQVRV